MQGKFQGLQGHLMTHFSWEQDVQQGTALKKDTASMAGKNKEEKLTLEMISTLP